MPPSGRSSSSHSSHSSSRSRSSSSSRSSSRSSYSSSSRSSSHSSSSSSRNTYGSSYSNSRNVFGSLYDSDYNRPSRSYSNSHSSISNPGVGSDNSSSSSSSYNYKCQPHGSATRYGRNHSYIYVANPYRDNSTGVNYLRGYYDEEGKHYDNLILRSSERSEGIFSCSYCDTKVKINWEKGEIPKCPNCGASLEREIENVPSDEVDAPNLYSGNNVKVDQGSFEGKVFLVVIAVLIVIFIALKIIGGFNRRDNEQYADDYNRVNTSDDYNSNVNNDSAIYVEEIGRTCHIDSEGFYYDKQTDCYFWFNTDIDPAQWQYWFESISSHFGEYGWMEYDQYENCWYIQNEYDEWIVLPDKYNTDECLWHFEDAYTY